MTAANSMLAARPDRSYGGAVSNPAPAAAKAPGDRPGNPPAPYFVNLPVDFLLIGGASILTYLAMRSFHDGSRTALIASLGLWLSWVVNWPHFSATSYRLYASREHLSQYPVTAVLAPILVGAGVLASFAEPQLYAPYFVKLFLIWSPYHFSGQSIGISLLYARRGRHKVGAAERFTLAAFIYGTFLIGTLRAETNLSGYVYYGISYPGFGIPAWVVSAVELWTYGNGAVFAGLLIRDAIRTRRLPPLMYLLPGITQFVWFVLGGLRPGYAEFVPFFHSLQYLLIAWAMQLKEKSDREGIAGTRGYVARESLRWYALNVAGGAALFWALPRLAAAAGVSTTLAAAVLIAAVQIHHFFVDGVIWKLRTRSVVSPLLVNVPQMVRGAVAPQPARIAA